MISNGLSLTQQLTQQILYCILVLVIHLLHLYSAINKLVLAIFVFLLQRFSNINLVFIPFNDLQFVDLGQSNHHWNTVAKLLDDFVHLCQALLLFFVGGSNVDHVNYSLGAFVLLLPEDSLPLSASEVLGIFEFTKKVTLRSLILTS